MCDSGHSPKRRRFFVETDNFHHYVGDTPAAALLYIGEELESESFLDGESATYTVTWQDMTDEEVAALPED